MGALHPTSAARPARPHATTASVQTGGGRRRAARGVTPDTGVCKQVPSSRHDRELTLPRTPTAPSALTGTQGGRPHREPAAPPRAAPPGPHAPGARRLVPPPPWPPLALRTSPAASPTRRHPLTTAGGWRRIQTGRFGAANKEYDPGAAGDEPLPAAVEAASVAMLPHSRAQLPRARPAAPGRPSARPRLGWPLPCPARAVGPGASRLPIGCTSARGRGGRERAVAGVQGRKSGTRPASFVTS